MTKMVGYSYETEEEKKEEDEKELKEEMTLESDSDDQDEETWYSQWRADDGRRGRKIEEWEKEEEEPWPRRVGGGGVMLEGYIEAADGDDQGSNGSGVLRTKSLTDEDLEELKGCLDLGFGFSYEEIPELCNTLPALELCYSMSQRFLDEQQRSQDRPSPAASGEVTCQCSPASPSVANWKISSPGDDPDDVKARLRYWAQAVACTVKLCS